MPFSEEDKPAMYLWWIRYHWSMADWN